MTQQKPVSICFDNNGYAEILKGSHQQSVRSNHDFAETMQRHYANMENILYEAEILCGKKPDTQFCLTDLICPFKGERIVESIPPLCHAHCIRRFFGEHVKQHDTTPEDTEVEESCG